MRIFKIALTGGPCAGRIAALRRVRQEAEARGYAVLLVPNAEAELAAGGVSPESCDAVAFQGRRMQLQRDMERAFERAAEELSAEKVLIACDQGMPDSRASLSAAEFAHILKKMDLSEVEQRDGYDAVFHLCSVDKGAVTPGQACAPDDGLIAAWTGHPHLRVIEGGSDRLIREIFAFLGDPEPLEIERKFLIPYPDLAALERLPNCRRVEIVQTYLQSEEGVQRRVRQRGCDGHYIYTLTEKRHLTPMRRVEVERRLSEAEYRQWLGQADPAAHPLRKARYCLAENGQYFEIDVYPQWSDRAVVEIELLDEDEPIRFPAWMEIVREVTGEAEYSNSALARRWEG